MIARTIHAIPPTVSPTPSSVRPSFPSSRKLRCHKDPKTVPSRRETSLYKSTTINISLSLSRRSAGYNKDQSSTRSIGHATRCSTAVSLQLQPTVVRQWLFSGFVLRPSLPGSGALRFPLSSVGSAAASQARAKADSDRLFYLLLWRRLLASRSSLSRKCSRRLEKHSKES